ncbi:LytTR family DNA-binding domain-containing protein [Phocaeicola sp. KGMB11183]|uniref:LytTR family DNA-binding domain-containing protein n=1 Tax=Phocaeicola acetigenes TaxID=3016083 RepID=A0ABT4PHU9_9BACT|nr:LytTR family DNA-binding domain-containing protein [Phocaeicola sp. KGMB11183]MCZ8372617.1 LytTR family DNA-binding domain-containing protein [Phocaeicola sp. KGMB11183]
MNGVLKCVAIDDEPMALLVIEQFCKRKGGMELTTFSEPHIGLKEIRRTNPDLVFLDIHMDSISGLDIAGTLPEGCCFIFTTAYAEYALEGFNLDAVDFLHKPFSYERFEIAVEKVLRRIEFRRSSVPECLVVKQEYSNVNIPLNDILYIEALGNYVKIVRSSGGHVLTRTNLKAITDLLPDKTFLRIHRSYVVSVSSVVSFTRTKVELNGVAELLPVGAQYAGQVVEVLGK